MNIKIFILILTGAAINTVSCQTDSLITSDRIIEEYSEALQSELDEEQLTEYLEYFKNFPVTLDDASLNDLFKIPFIEIKAVKYLLDASSRDLMTEEEVSEIITPAAMQFVRLKSAKAGDEKITGNLRIRCISDLRKARGYNENIYQGDQLKTYARLQINYGPNIFMNMLAEKDPGEKNYADFSSLSLMASGRQWNAVAGDYRFEFGQGLLLWGSGGFTAGGDALFPAIKHPRGIVPYTGAGEYSFFRGVAAEFNYAELNFSPFISIKKMDAVIDTLRGVVSSLPEDGYHRSATELEHKNKLNESLLGFSAGYDDNKLLSAGILFCHQEYDPGLAIGTGDKLSGSSFNSLALNYRIFKNKYYFCGELAFCNRYKASVNSFEIAVTPDITAVTL
jgi:hypothetical protein